MRQLYDNFIVVFKVWAHIRIQNCNDRTNALAEFRFVSTNELAASRLGRQLLAASRLDNTNELAASRLGTQLLAASRLNIIS